MANQPESERYAAAVQPYLSAVLRVAAAIVGTADAEDAAQEALLRGWQAWQTLRHEVALRAWLLRITVNLCLDWQRGRFGTQHRLVAPLDDGMAGERQLATIESDPGDSFHAAKLDLRQALSRLDEGFRLVVALRYYAGMDATEIGEALGVPAATIRTRLRRALLLLRDALGEADKQSGGLEQEGETHAHQAP